MPWIRRLVLVGVGVFVGFTFAWIAVGLANTGDAFPQGPARTMMPLLLVGPVLGGLGGARVRSRPAVVVLSVFAALAMTFWMLAPANWWASGPPPMP